MRPIPENLRAQIAADPFMAVCVHTGNTMVEWDHAFEYARKQVNEKWAIIPCEPQFNANNQGEVKRFHKWIALWRLMTSSREYFWNQLEKYPHFDFWRLVRIFHFEFDWLDYPELWKRLTANRIKE